MPKHNKETGLVTGTIIGGGPVPGWERGVDDRAKPPQITSSVSVASQRLEGERHRRRRRQVRSRALPPDKDGLFEIRGLDLEPGA
jgi:hypothetical protein